MGRTVDENSYEFDAIYCIFVDEMGLTPSVAEDATRAVLSEGISIGSAYGRFIVDLA